MSILPEIEVNPSSQHGHVASGSDVYILNGSDDFQLYRSSDVLTFIYGTGNTASYWGGGNQTIYEFGNHNTLRFSELEQARVDVYGLNSTDLIKIYNTDQTTIQSDGHGGTLVGNIDFHQVAVSPSQVSFHTVPETLSVHPGLVPLDA